MAGIELDERDLDTTLGQLVEDGTLRVEQAAAVHDALVGRPAGPPPGTAGPAVLAASYVGVGLIAAAIATFIGQSWDDLSVPARSVLFAVLTVALVGAGAPLRERFDPARGLAWLVAVVAAGGFGAAVLSAEGVDPTTTFLAAGVAALALAVPLLAARSAAPQVLGFVAGLLTIVFSLGARFEPSPAVGGAALWLVGMGVAAAGVVMLLPARPFTLAMGGLVALFGAHAAGADSVLPLAVLAVLLAGAAYTLAVRGEPAVPLTIATLTVATTGPRVLGQWLSGSIGAAGVLAASGLIVLGAVAAHVRLARRHGT
jgi:hypothetical protein